MSILTSALFLCDLHFSQGSFYIEHWVTNVFPLCLSHAPVQEMAPTSAQGPVFLKRHSAFKMNRGGDYILVGQDIKIGGLFYHQYTQAQTISCSSGS